MFFTHLLYKEPLFPWIKKTTTKNSSRGINIPVLGPWCRTFSFIKVKCQVMDTRYCYRMFQMVLLIALVLTLKHKENTPNEIMKIKLNFMGKNTVRMLTIRINHHACLCFIFSDKFPHLTVVFASLISRFDCIKVFQGHTKLLTWIFGRKRF